MRFLRRDDERCIFKLRVDSLDDLWYLNQAISTGAIVGGYTFRKLEAKEDQPRADSQPRVKVFLKIGVDSSEFHPFTDVLRLGGAILEGPPDISGHHTFNVGPGSVITLEYLEGCSGIIDMLEEAEKGSRKASAIAVSMDDENAEVFRLRDYGLDRIAAIRVSGGGKRSGGGPSWDEYYRKISDVIMQNLNESTEIVLSGPGFFKESLSRKLRAEYGMSGSRIHVLQSSSGGPGGLREAFGKGAGTAKVLEGMRIVQEMSVLEDLMSRVGRGKGATYGLEEVEKALSLGAVEILVISDRIFREGTGRELMTTAAETGSRTMVVSSVHELGKMFDKMGGVGAILRFEI